MSEQNPLDADGKARVKEALLEYLRAGLSALAGDAEEKREAGQLDQDTVLESDDTSHSDEDADLDAFLDDSAAARQRVIEEVEALDFSPREDVAPGAVVGFGDARYVVGVAVASSSATARRTPGSPPTPRRSRRCVDRRQATPSTWAARSTGSSSSSERPPRAGG